MDVTKYCVYVDPVYETVENEDGTKSQKLVKDGYYGWVEYDPDNKELNYTVSTTNGTLNIDYALLEGVVYYLQEKAAPDGYKVDSNIYVICDEESYQQMTAEKGVSSVINPATGVESAVVYMGAIKGGETLKVNFVNGKTAPKPDPTRIMGVAEATAVMEAAVPVLAERRQPLRDRGQSPKNRCFRNSRRKCRLKTFLHRDFRRQERTE